ncbi:MAG TPA: peptidoglycan-binding domain-containing protein [Bryobacteraceae bacterium]|nr:peptidoglycan-binding domain-containing protein [Bryobacteraceae bacterium]
MLRNLSIGMRGPDVLAVQQGLNIRKQPQDRALVEDGVFGAKTQAAVLAFQRRNNLTVDGVVGPRTRAAIFPLAVVTVRAFGMRLRQPSLLSFGQSQPTTPTFNPFILPPLSPTILGYQPLSYPNLTTPIATPLLAPPPLLPLTLPIHHFEISPGGGISLGRKPDLSFNLTLSGIVMIGDEEGNHQEFSSGIITSSPGVFQGGDWSVGWFAQLTHVEQLGRSGNFSWQPNAQVVFGNTPRPFLSVTASPANVQWDLNKSLSLSLGGPSVTATFAPEGASLGWGLASFGVVGKFN